jgi:putative tryptophan/tyrosine transport system substrate-binding protein
MIPRREVITLLGGAVATLSLAARAQQSIPAVGLLDPRSADVVGDRLRGFRQGLKDNAYVEGDNVTLVYRWAENQFARLPELAEDLVRRQVAVIAVSGSDRATAVAKVTTTTIPIVAIFSQDPVELGLVASLARPGGNVTGTNFFSGELSAKRLGFLHELLPRAVRIAVLVNPTDAGITDATLKDLGPAARALGVEVHALNASNSVEIDAAFTTLLHERYDALLVSSSAFFNSRRGQLVNLSMRHGIPLVSGLREYAEIGGLMSYGASVVDAYRQIGLYTGRILKGAKPSDLPVVQSTRFELIINARTARMLSIEVPPTLLAAADEVIE